MTIRSHLSSLSGLITLGIFIVGVLAVVLSSAPAHAAGNTVQVTSCPFGGLQVTSCAFINPVSQNDVLVVQFYVTINCGFPPTGITVTDSLSLAYTFTVGLSGFGCGNGITTRTETWTAETSTTSGADIITIHSPFGGDEGEIVLSEWSGVVNSIEGTSTGTGAGTNAMSVASFAPLLQSTIIGFGTENQFSPCSNPSPGVGYTEVTAGCDSGAQTGGFISESKAGVTGAETVPIIPPGTVNWSEVAIALREIATTATTVTTTVITTLTITTIITPRTTSTTISCSPSTIQDYHSTTCTATVTDTSPGTPMTPTGTVSWSSNGSGTFSSTTCILSGTGGTATCSVSFTSVPGQPSVITITGNYGGDADHSRSSGSTTIIHQ